jgi:hypothetical protein
MSAELAQGVKGVQAVAGVGVLHLLSEQYKGTPEAFPHIPPGLVEH